MPVGASARAEELLIGGDLTGAPIRARTSPSERLLHPRALPARLALRQFPVAADVAVLAADDHVDRVFGVAEVVQLADGRGGDPCQAAGLELVLGAVTELDRDVAAVEEVELLLLVVEVAAGREGGRQDDRVDAEGGDAQPLADLAEARPIAEVAEICDGVAVAFRHLLCRLAHGRGAYAAGLCEVHPRGSIT